MLYILVKKCYLKSPYQIGSKKSNSLVIGIPSKIVKEHQISTSTVFMLKHDESGILLQRVNVDKIGIPVDSSSEAMNQQVSC